ncbi:hypothetical protein AVEN_57232-1 [Araneus ventricosus]|uniref:Uncharacterized protein n=1 Tax=Araneus ventricosus TaxID=182803 RepID=A0A4Y2RKH0_ARAVE|nr:hypothetical protein AVEN_57232-1 [Araneus ventricosus]
MAPLNLALGTSIPNGGYATDYHAKKMEWKWNTAMAIAVSKTRRSRNVLASGGRSRERPSGCYSSAIKARNKSAASARRGGLASPDWVAIP